MARRFRNTRRENRLEELGRVDAEKAYTSRGKRNLREEKDRIRSELKSGGRATTRPMTPDQKRKPKKAGPSAPNPRKKMGPRDVGRYRIDKLGYTTHGGGPDAGNIGKFKDAISKAKKGLGKTVSPAQPDLSQIKKHMKKYKIPLRKGGRARGPNRPRPQGPHMWVRGDKRKKYAAGKVVKGAISGAKKMAKGLGKIGKGLVSGATKITRKKYASGGVVMAGKKVGCQIK